MPRELTEDGDEHDENGRSGTHCEDRTGFVMLGLIRKGYCDVNRVKDELALRMLFAGA
jgi:hypothetical protein